MTRRGPFVWIVLALAMCCGGFAAAEEAEKKTKDSTGTNPINFTNDFRIYVEHQDLNVGDDSGGEVMTFEFRKPIFEDYQIRTRIRGVSRSIDANEDGVPEANSTAVGDMDVRLLTVPYMKGKNAVAVGVESFWNTASNDLLGDGRWSFGPQIFLVRFGLFDIPGTLFAPGYQYVFDVGGEDGRRKIHKSQIDLFVLWIFNEKKNWILLDPQVVIDHEGNDKNFTVFDAEFGQMMFGGFSSYIRPGVGIGEDRPLDWNLELGFKVIWR
jgi:hypothetical protein